MSEPLLVKYGWLVWKVAVVGAGVLGTLVFLWWASRRRESYTGNRAVACIVVGLVAAAQVALSLAFVGELATEVAGDRPFDDRDSDDISELHPLVIAAATPGHRKDALRKFADAGFELEDTCERSWRRGEYERLVDRSDCLGGVYWRAQANLALGLPCAAADALDEAGFVGDWTRRHYPIVDFMSALGCHRWERAAEAATRLETDGGALTRDAPARWTCVAASLTARASGKPAHYPSENGSCAPMVLLDGTLDEIRGFVERWKALDEDRRLDLRDGYAIAYLLRVTSDGEHFTDDEVRREEDWEQATSLFDDRMFGPDFMTTAAPTLIEHLDAFTPHDQVKLHAHAALAAILVGDFAKAHGSVRAMETTAAKLDATRDREAGPDGLLARDVAIVGAVVTFREGGTPPRVEAWTYAKHAFETRRGELPAVDKRMGTEQADVDRFKAILAGDQHALGLMLHGGGSSHDLVGLNMGSLLSGALPRIRPAPPDLVRWLNEPHASQTRRAPADLAWDSAARRDALLALGEQTAAERWGQIARRQWALATDRELVFYFGYLHDAIRF
ncbi:MAG TPA: hypothetical protein VGM90_16365 [Kofleriaceae bacterium]|jgi:hypothetical protein